MKKQISSLTVRPVIIAFAGNLVLILIFWALYFLNDGVLFQKDDEQNLKTRTELSTKLCGYFPSFENVDRSCVLKKQHNLKLTLNFRQLDSFIDSKAFLNVNQYLKSGMTNYNFPIVSEGGFLNLEFSRDGLSQAMLKSHDADNYFREKSDILYALFPSAERVTPHKEYGFLAIPPLRVNHSTFEKDFRRFDLIPIFSAT